MTRYTDLVSRSATPVLNLDNAKTAVLTTKAAILGDKAAIDNMKVQLGWYTVTAPISGRVGVVTIKEGNVAKAGDNSATGMFATINQISPIYVAFSVTQTLLPALREAMAAGRQGGRDAAGLENEFGGQARDPRQFRRSGHRHDRGARHIRQRRRAALAGPVVQSRGDACAIEPNTVVAPREAIQIGQSGNFVFTVSDGVAHVVAGRGRAHAGRRDA